MAQCLTFFLLPKDVFPLEFLLDGHCLGLGVGQHSVGGIERGHDQFVTIRFLYVIYPVSAV